MRNYRIPVIVILCLLSTVTQAQAVLDIIRHDPSFASTNYSIYPDSVEHPMTPPPAGKRPFYLSHYGRHGSRFINNRSGYDIPHKMLLKADTLGQLTEAGHRVLDEVRWIISETETRWGDLTGYGQYQHRKIARRMVERFPEIFGGDAHIDARSTIVNRCIISMGSAMQVMLRINPRLQVRMEASKRDMWYMNHQDRQLRNKGFTPEAKAAEQAYLARHVRKTRLMDMLFHSPDSMRQVIDEQLLNYYIIKMGLFQQNTHLYKNTYLTDIFETEDLYALWQKDNIWWYIQHGGCTLNGGRQPYSQRYLLRKIIEEADSCIRLERPGAQLRFGHETVLMPLTCLIGINGADLQTADLEELEEKGWWSSSIFPMGSNLQLVFYRTDTTDKDVLLKVLLNEQEATLPITTDCAPYYHWSDFRDYYLAKLDRYEENNK